MKVLRSRLQAMHPQERGPVLAHSPDTEPYDAMWRQLTEGWSEPEKKVAAALLAAHMIVLGRLIEAATR